MLAKYASAVFIDELSCAAPLKGIETSDANDHHDSSHCHSPENVKQNQSIVGQGFVDKENYKDCLNECPDTLPSSNVKQNNQIEPTDPTTVVETFDSPQGTYLCDLSVCILPFLIVMDTSIIRLPNKIKKRGRPKGGDLTVVGLPKKKKAFNKPVAFLKMHPKDQERGNYIVM